MNTKLRKLDTSYRIMKVLKLLHENPMELSELCYELDRDCLGVNRETITKYFSTLREVGCVIEKRGGKFYLKHLPFFINFNESELEILAMFQKFTQKLHQKNIYDKIQGVFLKILKLTDISAHNSYHKILNSVKFTDVYYKNKDKLELFSNLFDENSRKLKIIYRGKDYKILPKNFKFNKTKVYLFAFNETTKKHENFLLDDIVEVISLVQSASCKNFASSTVFKITDRLAKGYYPYEGETVFEMEKSIKIITNKIQEKNELRTRLLRYGELCEIVSPQDEKDAFVEELDAMIANYEHG